MLMCTACLTADTYRTVMHSVEAKKTNVQRLRKEMERIERDTESKLTEIDASNAQLKVHGLFQRAVWERMCHKYPGDSRVA